MKAKEFITEKWTKKNEEVVAEGSKQDKDMTGQTCQKCKKDKYQERSQHDDMDGKVTCSCGNRVDRWKKYKEQGVAEADMGKHNNGTTGFKALAKKAGGGEKGAKIAGAQFQKMKKAGQLEEDWNKVNHHDKTNGLSQKAVNAYRREHPGSKLKTAVTTKPSKLKAGSKAAKRRKSFCARMGGNKGPMKKPNGKPTPKALALRRWNCESIEQMQQMIILGEQYISNLKEAGSPAQQAAIAINMKKNHKKPKK